MSKLIESPAEAADMTTKLVLLDQAHAAIQSVVTA